MLIAQLSARAHLSRETAVRSRTPTLALALTPTLTPNPNPTPTPTPTPNKVAIADGLCACLAAARARAVAKTCIQCLVALLRRQRVTAQLDWPSSAGGKDACSLQPKPSASASASASPSASASASPSASPRCKAQEHSGCAAIVDGHRVDYCPLH